MGKGLGNTFILTQPTCQYHCSIIPGCHRDEAPTSIKRLHLSHLFSLKIESLHFYFRVGDNILSNLDISSFAKIEALILVVLNFFTAVDFEYVDQFFKAEDNYTKI